MVPDTSPQPSTGVEPSSEAVERWRSQFGGGMIPFDTAYHRALKAGAIPADAQTAGVLAVLETQAPAIHAAGVAEGRAAMLRDVLAWLRAPQGMGGDSIRRMGDASAIEAAFPTTGEKT